MPRLSGLLDAPWRRLVGLEKDGDALRAKRPMYAGNAIGTVELVGAPLLFTVRQTAFDAAPMAGESPVEKAAVAAEAGGTAFVSGRRRNRSGRS